MCDPVFPALQGVVAPVVALVAGPEVITHTALWQELMRIHIQLKFGTQSPALSSDELKTTFDLRSVVCARWL